MSNTESLVNTLVQASQRQAQNPWEAIDWPESLEALDWCFSPELVSLLGTPEWEAANEEQRRRLCLSECVNFFSLNVHGERALLVGLTERLYRSSFGEVTPYLHHFLDEENKHMQYFGRFCNAYAGGVYPERKMPLGSDASEKGIADLLFFARVLVFEMLVDAYNQRMAKDERLAKVVREINRIHHQEEARHLSFGRHILERLAAEAMPEWSAEELTQVQGYLSAYIESVWAEYYNPQAYLDAGFDDAYALRRRAYECDHQVTHRRTITVPVRSILNDLNLLHEGRA